MLIVGDDRIDEFQGELCERERCPVSVIGVLTEDDRLVVRDRTFANRPVDMPMQMLLGNPPRMTRDVERTRPTGERLDLSDIELEEAALRVLRFPAVASKAFLIHIGDRTVGGLSARDQLVGPWQVPVSDVAITSSTFNGYTGEAMAMGERTPLAALECAGLRAHGGRRVRSATLPRRRSGRFARCGCRRTGWRRRVTRAKMPTCSTRSRPWVTSCAAKSAWPSLSVRTRCPCGPAGNGARTSSRWSHPCR